LTPRKTKRVNHGWIQMNTDKKTQLKFQESEGGKMQVPPAEGSTESEERRLKGSETISMKKWSK
jgi:hypothetical protein